MSSVFVGILNKDNRVYSGNEIHHPEEDYLENVYGKIAAIIHRVPIIISITEKVSIILVSMEEYEMLDQNKLLNCNIPRLWDDHITKLILFDANNPI